MLPKKDIRPDSAKIKCRGFDLTKFKLLVTLEPWFNINFGYSKFVSITVASNNKQINVPSINLTALSIFVFVSLFLAHNYDNCYRY